MRRKLWTAALCLAASGILLLQTGCLGDFAANQARRQAARSADKYIREYAEPELEELYADDPQAQRRFQQNFRQSRNDMADTIVRSGNPRQQSRVGVGDNGWLTNE